MKERAFAKTGLTSSFCGSVFVTLRFDRKYGRCLDMLAAYKAAPRQDKPFPAAGWLVGEGVDEQ